MRHQDLIKVLSETEARSIDYILREMDISERLARKVLSELRQDGRTNGFTIMTIRSIGYILNVDDRKKYDAYMLQSNVTQSFSREDRIQDILYFMLQSDDYISMEKLSETLQVSRSTTIRDMEQVKRTVEEMDLILISKKNKGVKVTGTESALRSAISKYVIHSFRWIGSTQDYFVFLETLDIEVLSDIVNDTFDSQTDIVASKEIRDSVVDHCKVMLYRLSKGNYVQEFRAVEINVAVNVANIAYELVEKFSKTFKISIPSIEVDYLAAQLSGKLTTVSISTNLKEVVLNKVTNVLKQLDKEYLTDFENDYTLKKSLHIHMIPLLNRISLQTQFKNPLVDIVSMDYANVFSVAIRYVEMWSDGLILSSDEIGYLALHFASSLERKRVSTLSKFESILVVSQLGRSNVLLIKEKISDAFKNSIVEIVIDTTKLQNIKELGVDLILTTINLDKFNIDSKIPIIRINEIINDHDVHNIKEQLILKWSNYEPRSLSISELIHEELFSITDEDKYQKILFDTSSSMEDLGYAKDGFKEAVLDREKRHSTVYINGIAGPHPLKMKAIKNSIAVVIPKKKVVHDNKVVKIVFLINLKTGNLFLHRKISQFISMLSENQPLLNNLISSESYPQFIDYIKRIE